MYNHTSIRTRLAPERRAVACLFLLLLLLAVLAGCGRSNEDRGSAVRLEQNLNATFVQLSSATPQTPKSSVTVPFTAAQSAGNLNVVVVGWNDTVAQVVSVTDSKGNVYARAIGPTTRTTTLTQSIYYAANIAAAVAGANVVTVTFNTAATWADIRMVEYSGIDPANPIDVSSGRSGSGATSSTLAVTTTNASDLLFSANMVTSYTKSAGSGWTKRTITDPDGDLVQDRGVTATGAYTSTAPLNGGADWIMQMVAFRTAGGSPPDTQPPTNPSNLIATASSSSQIDLSWTASTDNVGVTSYQVDRCQGTACTTFAQIGTSSVASFNDLGLAAGTTYRYRVRAADAAGNVSANSSIVTATTQTPPDTTAPTAPSALTATAASASQINLGWAAATDNVGVTGYRVERCQGGGCTNFAQIAAPTATNFNDTGLAASTSYSYQVRAVDAAGNLGPYSNIATATTQAPDTTAPTAPTGLSATAAGGTQINLAWTASTDNVAVTGYQVERCQGAGCTSFAQTATAIGTSFGDAGLTGGMSYSYRIRATDAAGNLSAYSGVASATTSSVAAGLVASYSFDEGSGTTLADSSGNGNNGTVSGATWTTAGRFRNALVFNGTSSRVTIPNSTSLQLTTGMTLEAWVFPTADPTGWRSIVYKTIDGYYLMLNPGPTVGGTWTSGTAWLPTPTSLALNEWTHLAATFDGTAMRMYVNGGLVDSQPQTAPLSPTTGTLQIGADGYPGEFFEGRIDDVRIYNRALSASEVRQLYLMEGAGPVVSIIKAVKPSFALLSVGTNYQLQVSSDLVTWTNQGTPFIATNGTMTFPQYWDVDNWSRLFFRLQITP